MPTVLLVDDDVVLMARLATQLTEAGYRALQANDLKYAEHLIEDEGVDLLLIDPGIAAGAGWSLLERLAPHLPVLAIGDGREEQVIRGLNAGVVDYLAKPVRSGELLARLRGRLRLPPADDPAAHAPAATLPPLHMPDPAPQAPAWIDEAATLGDDQDPNPQQPPSRRARRDEEEEPVFIPHSEEQRLLNGELPDTVDTLDRNALSRLPLGERLKAARQRRRITLVQAELDTRMRMYYIQAIEEEKFALLPRGPVTEMMLRSYATYLGLDPSQALEEYRKLHYSAPIEPPLALGGVPLPRRLPNWIPITLAVVLALLIGGGAIWLIDPRGVLSLGERARALVVPPTATATPTASLTPTLTPTASPTQTASPTATSTPTASPQPTRTPSATAEPSVAPTASRRPAPRPTAAPPPPTQAPPTAEPPTPAPATEAPPAGATAAPEQPTATPQP